MGKNAEEFLAEVGEYLGQVHDSDASSQLAQIIAAQAKKDFRVCIAGGFSRGKTHLVNQLLGTDIFPEMALPTTSLLTAIEYGSALSLTHEWQGKNQTYSNVAEALSRFSATGDMADAGGILHAAFPHALLAHNICLYDTPGIDDILEHRATVTFNALEHCDAALVLVSAVNPLSLMEKSFIETYIYKRAIPRIALVLTFLDNIPKEDRLSQLDYIRSKAHAICPDMELWSTTELEPSQASGFRVSGIPAIRERLTQWPNLPDTKALNDKRTLCLLEDLLGTTLKRQQALFNNLQQDKSTRQEELAHAFDALDEKSDVWRQLRDDFLNSGERTAAEARQKAAQCCSRLMQGLHQDSEDVFAANLREILRESAADISAQISEHIQEDINILDQNLTEKLGLTPGCVMFPEPISISTENFDVPQHQNTDSILDILQKFASDILDNSAFPIPIPPLAKKIIGGITVFVEDFKPLLLSFGAKKRQQKYEAVISQFQNMLDEQLQSTINRIYSETAEDVRQRQRKWLQQQKSMLREDIDLASLQQEIAAATKNMERGKNLLNELSEARS